MILSNTQFSTALCHVLPLMFKYLPQSPYTLGIQTVDILQCTLRPFKMKPLRCLETSAQINQWRGARPQKDGRSQSHTFCTVTGTCEVLMRSASQLSNFEVKDGYCYKEFLAILQLLLVLKSNMRVGNETER